MASTSKSIVLPCALFLAACGGDKPPPPLAAPPEPAAPAPAPAKPAGPLKVAFAYVGPVGDAGWSFSHDKGRKAVQLAANGLAYATGLEPPRPKLSKVDLAADGPRDEIRRGFLKVAQLQHGGVYKPAPRAMRNLMVEDKG